MKVSISESRRRMLRLIAFVALAAHASYVFTGCQRSPELHKREALCSGSDEAWYCAPELDTLREALASGAAARIDGVLRSMARDRREGLLVGLVERLPSGNAKDAAMIALGKYGSMGAYGILRGELLRPSWTTNVRLLSMSDLVRAADPWYADWLVYLWIREGALEDWRQTTALEALMLLTGYVPTSLPERVSCAEAGGLVRELDAQVRTTPDGDRSVIVKREVPQLVSIVATRTESRQRKRAALWILGHYANWPLRKDIIDLYLESTPPVALEQQWRNACPGVTRTADWDYDNGHAKGLERIRDILSGLGSDLGFY